MKVSPSNPNFARVQALRTQINALYADFTKIPKDDPDYLNKSMDYFRNQQMLLMQLIESSGVVSFQDFQTLQVVNGLLTFGTPDEGPDNISGTWIEVVSPVTPDTEFSVTHNLDRIPSGFLVFSQDKAGTLYKGDTAWSTTLLYLKASVASLGARIFVT